jgi:hypothetical protein
MSEKLVTEFVPKTTIWYQYCSFQFYNPFSIVSLGYEIWCLMWLTTTFP